MYSKNVQFVLEMNCFFNKISEIQLYKFNKLAQMVFTGFITSIQLDFRKNCLIRSVLEIDIKSVIIEPLSSRFLAQLVRPTCLNRFLEQCLQVCTFN